jgi:hypothetical protein
MAALERLLGFVSAHTDGRNVFHPSDMQLAVLTDASYLLRPNARAFHHILGLINIADYL